MTIPRSTPKKARIEIIPMIDTMFFLLVFFMVATLSMTQQNGLPVNLPQASSVQNETQQLVTLTMTKDNKLYFDKEELESMGNIMQKLKQQNTHEKIGVIINADRSVEHGRVVELMDAVRQSGITKISVAVSQN